MNEHILNAMSMIASTHRDLYFKYPLTLGNKGQAMNKLVVALGDLAYYSNHVEAREARCEECEVGPEDEGLTGVSGGHVYGCSHYAY